MLVLFPPEPAPRALDPADVIGVLDDLAPMLDDPDIEVILLVTDHVEVRAIVAARWLPDALAAALVAIGAGEVWLVWRHPSAALRCRHGTELTSSLADLDITIRDALAWSPTCSNS